MHLGKGFLALWTLALCHVLAAAQTSPDDCYHDAAESYRAADWSAATNALRDFVSRFPDDPRALGARFYLGEAHLQRGQLAEARASYRTFVDQLGGRSHDDEATARFRIGEASFLLNDPALADSALGEFCGRYPGHRLLTYALPYLAELAIGRGDFEKALQHAKRQLSLGGRRPFEAQLIAARAYHAMGQFAAARDACLAIERDARSDFDIVAKSRLIVAQSYAAQGQWQAAARAYQRLATLRPVASTEDHNSTRTYRAAALLGAADCYRQLGERQLANQTYTTVLLEFPHTESSEQATERLTELANGMVI